MSGILRGVMGAILVGAIGVQFAAADPVDYSGYNVLRVNVTSPAQLDQIERTGALIMDCIPGVGEMTVLANDAQTTAINNFKMPLSVVHDNVAEILAAQNASVVRGAPDPFDDFFDAYRRYDNGTGSIVWYMNELVNRYPDQAEMVNVGTTLQGRAIWGLHLTDLTTNSVRPAAVYFSCEHAREWITTSAPTYFATHLLTEYAQGNPAIVDLVDNVEFYLIPVFNVDGYEYSWTSNRFWRKNRRNNGDGTTGVDINRNWGEGWGGNGASSDTSSETYHGTAPFSEIETQVMRDFFLAHPNIRAQLDIHSFSQLILWPFGFTSSLPEDQNIYSDIGFGMQADIFAVHGANYTAGPIYTTIYPVSGGSVDWTYVQRGVLSFSFEMRPASGGLSGFDPPPTEIIPNNEELLPAILRLSNSDWVRSIARFDYDGGEPPTQVNRGESTPIFVDVIGQLGDVIPSSVMFHYRTDPAAAFTSVPANAVGGDSFQVDLPATNCQSQLEYYFTAATDIGGNIADPKEGPIAPYNADIVEIALNDDLESASGWSVGAPGDGATSGIWTRVNPVGTAAQPEDDHTPGAGSICYVTGQGAVGGSEGAADVDGGATTLLSPVFDISQMIDPQVSYWRWFSNDKGTNPNQDVFVIEISADGGGVWTEVETVGPSGPQSSGGWYRSVFSVAGLVGAADMIQLRFVASDDLFLSIVEAAIDDLQLIDPGCVSTAGDNDGDGDLDLVDFKAFVPCATGPLAAVEPGCAIFDFDLDNDIDAMDHAAFQAAD